MALDRRQFVGGSLVSMMAVLLGVSPQEAEAQMEAAEQNPDDALVFLIDGTKDAPQIRVQGVIKALSMDSHTDYDSVYSGGVVVGQFLRSQTFTAKFTGPFTMTFVDEKKFWGVK